MVGMPNWAKQIVALICKMWDLMILGSVWVFNSDGDASDISCLRKCLV